MFHKSSTQEQASAAKAKTHWFKNLDLISVLQPAIDDGVFTGSQRLMMLSDVREMPSHYRIWEAHSLENETDWVD